MLHRVLLPGDRFDSADGVSCWLVLSCDGHVCADGLSCGFVLRVDRFICGEWRMRRWIRLSCELDVIDSAGVLCRLLLSCELDVVDEYCMSCWLVLS